jgi:hypothetical protein
VRCFGASPLCQSCSEGRHPCCQGFCFFSLVELLSFLFQPVHWTTSLLSPFSLLCLFTAISSLPSIFFLLHCFFFFFLLLSSSSLFSFFFSSVRFVCCCLFIFRGAMDEAAVRAEYAGALQELRDGAKAHINMLTMLAGAQ